jgi:aspartate/methionine/tyrosine aminotransferase
VKLPLFLTRFLIQSGIARFLPRVRRLTDGGGAFVHYYSNRVLAAPLAELTEAARFLELPEPDGIDLALGAPRFDILPSTTRLAPRHRGYPPPWGLPELREAVAAKLHAEDGLAVKPTDEVLITHGAAGAFSVVLDTFVNPGHAVVLFDPTSPLYRLAAQQRRARLRLVPTAVEDGRLRFRVDRLARALQGARLLVLDTPANPTGATLSADDLEQIAWWADQHDVLIFNDTVHAAYQYEGERQSIATLPRAARRTLTAGSLSKSHALTHARVGWLAGHRHLVRPCALTQSLQTPFVPTPSQELALTALRQDPATLAKHQSTLAARRRYTHERLTAFGLKPLWPAGGFFFWVPIPHRGRTFAEELLRARKVLVTPGDLFGPSGAKHVRISCALEDGRLHEGLSRLGDWLRENREAMPLTGRKAA